MARTRSSDGLWARRAIFVANVVLSGCSLFVSLDDLSGESAADSGAEGLIDAAASDVVARDVAAADANGDGDAAKVCTGFCDSFDDRTTVVGAWAEVGHAGGGQASDLTIASDVFLSPPHSLHVSMPARMAAGPNNTAILDRAFPLTSGHISIDFDVKIVGSAGGFSGFANIVELTLAGNYAGSLTAGAAGNTVLDYWVNLEDGGHNQPIYDLGLTDSAWHHVHYAMTYDPTRGTVDYTYDGKSIASVSSSDTYGTPPVPNAFTLALGYSNQPSMPKLDIYIDNVQVQ